MGLKETKLQNLNLNRIHLLWGTSNVRYVVSDATESNSGGVIMLCSPEAFRCQSVDQNDK